VFDGADRSPSSRSRSIAASPSRRRGL
jgi:hypothetical protein